MENLIITPDTKIHELLETYPELEDKLIEVSPQFEKLRNPFLRKTIARVTTIRQAAIIGKTGLSNLVNLLRSEVGQDQSLIEEKAAHQNKSPHWLEESKIKVKYDANLDLEQGIHPINKVTNEMEKLNEGEIYLLQTSFHPAPLIELMEQKGYETFVKNLNANEVQTFIKK